MTELGDMVELVDMVEFLELVDVENWYVQKIGKSREKVNLENWEHLDGGWTNKHTDGQTKGGQTNGEKKGGRTNRILKMFV